MNNRSKTRPSKACEIPPYVKQKVWERDEGKCILCGSSYAASPSAHYIPRAALGLGIEENIVTLCFGCHRLYDQSDKRGILKEEIKRYLQSKYPNWDEKKLVYRKYGEIEDYYDSLSHDKQETIKDYINELLKEEEASCNAF